ncbi:MAG: hypothetical protein O3A19_13140, partial [Planctomycetota bacterium]|nr:hypothetical protein [Planctomycetota bacterium]
MASGVSVATVIARALSFEEAGGPSDQAGERRARMVSENKGTSSWDRLRRENIFLPSMVKHDQTSSNIIKHDQT